MMPNCWKSSNRSVINYIAGIAASVLLTHAPHAEATQKCHSRVLDTSVGAADTTDCACSEVAIICAPAVQFPDYCAPGAIACASNEPVCQMYLNEDDCTRLGIGSTNGAIPIAEARRLLPENCSDLYRPGAGNPEVQYQRMNACCSFRHELVHLSEPRCFEESSVECLEEPAYEESLKCTQDITLVYCEDNPDDAICESLCYLTLGEAALANLSACLCSYEIPGQPAASGAAFSPPRIPPEAYQRCHRECVFQTSPDDLPSECGAFITWGPVTGELIDAYELLESMCLPPSPRPSASPRPSGSPQPTP